MSNILGDYVFTSKYARTVNGEKETWEQAINRVINMHRVHLLEKGVDEEIIDNLLGEVAVAYKNKKILGAQRALQWGGEQLLTKHSRLYNCASSYLDRLDFFNELMFLLLSGAGVGYSVQKHHIEKLPINKGVKDSEYVKYTIPDSIEGWADSVQMLIKSYFYHTASVEFDFSKIRPKGALISGGFIAPGPEPLEKALDLLKSILENSTGRKLTTVEASDMACIIADAVISGGVRRSALIALFSIDDKDMINYKTGNWFNEKPYRSRVNISAVVLPETTEPEFRNLFKATKQFGEPGFAFLDDKDYMYNPCFEVGMYPQFNGKSGFSFCNLTEIVGKNIEDKYEFYAACRVASILGTIQATYTDLDYLSPITKKIVERDSLIGVGITGMAENVDLFFDPEIQRIGAEIVKETNEETAELLGINPAVRCTVIKPSGNSSAMMETSSGIHPFHAKRYIRNVQANKEEIDAKLIQETNSEQVEQSIYNSNDIVISFPVEQNGEKLVKSNVSAIELLDLVKLTQSNWIEYGTRYPQREKLRHNVSNTITVNDDEWDDVMNYLWKNRSYFTGVSLLSSSGDLDYNQAPYIEVLDEVELAEKYGSASILAGGLNVDGIHTFDDLWVAIDYAINKYPLNVDKQSILDTVNSNLKTNPDKSVYFSMYVDGVLVSDLNAVIANMESNIREKRDWVRRFKKFANKYFDGDNKKTGECLKQVSIFHKWNSLKNLKPINWNFDNRVVKFEYAGNQIGAACHGGACDVIE